MLRFQLTWLVKSFFPSVPGGNTAPASGSQLFFLEHLFFFLLYFNILNKCRTAKVLLLLNTHRSCFPSGKTIMAVLCSHPLVFLESHMPHLYGQIYFAVSASPHCEAVSLLLNFETSRYEGNSCWIRF